MGAEMDWRIRQTGWRILVEGDTPREVHVRFELTPERRADAMPDYTAHRPVNAMPYICATAPGFVTMVDFPQVVTRLA
jgi:hypothetical protein